MSIIDLLHNLLKRGFTVDRRHLCVPMIRIPDQSFAIIPILKKLG
jgi:hypothetical protein